jgi:serine protease Do
VVGDDAHVKVLVEDSKRLTGRVYRIDAARDLALVRLPSGDYRSASLGQGSDVILGAPATAIGYPLNLAGPATVTAGIVSRILYQPDVQRELIQTDAAINRGSSGGPLLDANGQVIGIMASVEAEYLSKPTSGISYAVSVGSIADDFLGSTLTQ